MRSAPRQIAAAEQVLEQLREELDDHRQAINENADELSGTYAYVQAIEARLAQLSDAVSELRLLVKGSQAIGSRFVFQPLNQREKEVFQALYELTETQPSTTYALLSKRLGLSDHLVSVQITRIIEKGIPVIKRMYSGKLYLSLDHEFRIQQAKKNLVGIDQKLAYWLGSVAAKKSQAHSQGNLTLDFFDEKSHSQDHSQRSD